MDTIHGNEHLSEAEGREPCFSALTPLVKDNRENKKPQSYSREGGKKK